jgi:hypothetical protein
MSIKAGDGKKKTFNGDGSGNGGDGNHPLIEGLIKALPESGAGWPLEARRKWLQAAAMNFDFVYTDPADTHRPSIRVSLDKETFC